MRHKSMTVLLLIGLGLLAWCVAGAQQASRGVTPPAAETHGDPKGWKFKLPATGDPPRGRAVFQTFECFSCHEVQGQKFPAPSKKDTLGPELASMVGHHSPAFLAESIINPNAWIDMGKGYDAPDGSSKMPSFANSITVQELIDVVAFLRNLQPAPAPARHGRH